MNKNVISLMGITLMTALAFMVTAPVKAEIVADENVSLVTGQVVSAEERDPLFNAGTWTITLNVASSEAVPVNPKNPAEGTYTNMMEKYIGKTIVAKGRIFRLGVTEQDLRGMAGKTIKAYIIMRSFNDFSIQRITILKPEGK